MSSPPTTVRSAVGPVALVVALLALLASAAGIGYAAATIGTNDIQDNAVTAAKIKKNAVTGAKVKKNAVTSKRIKNGSLKPADLAPQEQQKKPTLGNGGEGDCLWTSGESEVPGTGAPAYRKDRNGRVILTGIGIPNDAAGGDGVCDPSDLGQAADGIIFTLPAGYLPAKTQYLFSVGGILLITGPQGFVQGPNSLPAGVVYSSGAVLLDGVEFDPAGSDVVIAKVKASGRWPGALL